HCVESHDQRLRELVHERQHVFAVAATEDAVLVLQQHDVDVGASEPARGAHVVAAGALRDRLEDLGSLRRGRLVDDHEGRHVVDPVRGEERLTYVVRERADTAGPWWIRREDGDTHVGLQPPTGPAEIYAVRLPFSQLRPGEYACS